MRTVCVSPDQGRAEQARRFYAKQALVQAKEAWGEVPLVYRVHKMPDGWHCTGYKPAELRETTRGTTDDVHR